MEVQKFLQEVATSIDNKDAKKFASFITPDGQFRFGNAPAVYRTAEIEKVVDWFFSTIKIHSFKNPISLATILLKTLQIVMLSRRNPRIHRQRDKILHKVIENLVGWATQVNSRQHQTPLVHRRFPVRASGPPPRTFHC